MQHLLSMVQKKKSQEIVYTFKLGWNLCLAEDGTENIFFDKIVKSHFPSYQNFKN